MMVSLPTSVRIWLATRATDLRKSFDSLAELVRQQLQGDPLSGQLFVFRNKRADRVKLLYWDEDGFVIVYKRIIEVACNAHARRKFHEARDTDLVHAHQALAYYRQLYELERAATAA